jgi:two-component system, probable response regulator PhcQ
MRNTILLVDDEPNVTAALKRALLDEDLEIFTAASGQDALDFLNKTERVKVVISDDKMPGMDGAEFLSAVKERWPETVRIMLTGHASVGSTMKAVNSGEIYRFFTKPWNDYELIVAIRGAMEKFDLEAENRRLLRTVRHQATELKSLERKYPGITSVEKDEEGSFLLPDISEDELSRIIDECCKG